ncbi:MAG: hypothetical protein QXT77_08585 [Candidatus Methanomethylicaceae archaeon]
MPCRFNKRREWTHRIILESKLREDNAFLTLTYRFEQYTEEGLGTLDPAHTRNFLKRLRKAYEPRRFRYFLVGEYGDRNFRPHYHAALFGFPTCRKGRTFYHPRKAEPTCCASCIMVHRAWALGRIDLACLEPDSAQYVAGYTVKKMTAADDPRLEGRHPEFTRMSLKPGIGADMMHEVASTLLVHDLDLQSDVPVTLRHGNREYPLGRYLRRKLRVLVGKDEKTPQHILDQYAEELRPLREAAFNNSSSFKEEVIKAGTPRFKKMEAKMKIRKKDRDL